MWAATLLARYKCAGGKMLIIVKYGVYKSRSHIFIKGDGANGNRRWKILLYKRWIFDVFKDYGLMVNKEMVIKDLAIFALKIDKIAK